MKFKIISFISLFLATYLMADIRYVVTDGYGITQSEAITEALTEAIKQTKGVSIKSKKDYTLSIQNFAKSENAESSSSTLLQDSFVKKIKEDTKGLVDHYKLLSMNKEGDTYKASVKVGVYQYVAPGLSHNSRIKLAMYPFSTMNLGSEEYLSLSQGVLGALTQSRKFAILDRGTNTHYQEEKALIQSQDFKAEEKEKLKKKIAADYSMSGSFNYMKLLITTKTSYTGNGISNKKSFEASLNYQIHNFSTGQLKWSDTIIVKGDIPLEYESSALNYASREIGKKLSLDIISNIYPLRIASITESSNVVINQGGSTLNSGDIFNVYALGNMIYDPYTKEPLGQEEVKVGTIEITRVNPKTSYAQVIDGWVQEGCIVRSATQDNDTPDNNIASTNDAVKATNSGSVAF